VAALEKAAIEEALAAEEGNQTRAAKRLGISERALRYKLAKYRDNG
jgi:DNA-binding NtrC family response regulator